MKTITSVTNNTIYVSEVMNGKKDGVGHLLMSDGTDHFGEWKDDTMNGVGFEQSPDGHYLAGTWKFDQLDGPASMYISSAGSGIGLISRFSKGRNRCAALIPEEGRAIHFYFGGEHCRPLGLRWMYCIAQTCLTAGGIKSVSNTLRYLAQDFRRKKDALRYTWNDTMPLL
jgi:hypothetical protein